MIWVRLLNMFNTFDYLNNKSLKWVFEFNVRRTSSSSCSNTYVYNAAQDCSHCLQITKCRKFCSKVQMAIQTPLNAHRKKIIRRKSFLTSIYKPFQFDTLPMWKAHQHQKLRLATLRFLPHFWNIMSLWLDFQVCWNASNWSTCWLTALLFIFNNERAVRKRTTWKSFHETSKKDSNIITSPT